MAEINKTVSKGAVLQYSADGNAEEAILDTDYADDMAVLDNSKHGLQESTDLLCKYTLYAGLKVNVPKTKCMAFGKDTSQQP